MAAESIPLIRCEFTFQCPQRWDLLTPTTTPGVRHCARCEREVFLIRTDAELRDRATRGECVAVPHGTGVHPAILDGDFTATLGMPSAPYDADLGDETGD